MEAVRISLIQKLNHVHSKVYYVLASSDKVPLLPFLKICLDVKYNFKNYVLSKTTVTFDKCDLFHFVFTGEFKSIVSE